MIDQTRNPQNTYRVDRNWEISQSGLDWQIKIYEFGGGNVSHIVREDQIPQWLLDRMKTLDIAYKNEGVELPGYGSRFGSTYWIMADQVNGVELVRVNIVSNEFKAITLAIDDEDSRRMEIIRQGGGCYNGAAFFLMLSHYYAAYKGKIHCEHETQ